MKFEVRGVTFAPPFVERVKSVRIVGTDKHLKLPLEAELRLKDIMNGYDDKFKYPKSYIRSIYCRKPKEKWVKSIVVAQKVEITTAELQLQRDGIKTDVKRRDRSTEGVLFITPAYYDLTEYKQMVPLIQQLKDEEYEIIDIRSARH